MMVKSQRNCQFIKCSSGGMMAIFIYIFNVWYCNNLLNGNCNDWAFPSSEGFFCNLRSTVGSANTSLFHGICIYILCPGWTVTHKTSANALGSCFGLFLLQSSSEWLAKPRQTLNVSKRGTISSRQKLANSVTLWFTTAKRQMSDVTHLHSNK